MLEFADEYKTAVNYFLTNKLMNTEQQLLYAMYSGSGRRVIKPGVELRTYHRRVNIQNHTIDSLYTVESVKDTVPVIEHIFGAKYVR